MTLAEAIAQADETNKNPYTVKQKIIWLSRCETIVKN